MTDDIGSRLRHAIACARAGGDLTLEHFRPGVFEAERKSDGSPVTVADRGCETLIRSMIREAFPDDGMLGEEFGDEAGSSGYRWIVDPIDGTFSFVHGVPLYTTLIGIERIEDGVVGAGVARAPALDEMVYAHLGGGAWHVVGSGDPVRARVTETASLAAATVSTTSLDYWDDAQHWVAVDEACAHTRCWPDAYAVMLVATGRCDGVLESNLHAWDIAPFGPILSEAGGRATDWRGRTTVDTTTLIASNGAIHDELLAMTGRFAG